MFEHISNASSGHALNFIGEMLFGEVTCVAIRGKGLVLHASSNGKSFFSVSMLCRIH